MPVVSDKYRQVRTLQEALARQLRISRPGLAGCSESSSWDSTSCDVPLLQNRVL